MTSLFRLDVERDVQIAKWGLAGLLTLMGLFFWLVYLPDVKEIREDISGLNTNVAVQTATVNTMSQTLTRIEGKLDEGAPPQKSVPTQ